MGRRKKMSWVLAAAGGVVAFVILVLVLGTLLPRDHVASRAATYRRPPEALFRIITDIPAEPAWRPEVSKVEPLPDEGGHRRWREITRFGPVTFVEREVEAPRRFVTEIADPDLPFGGTWTYELTPAGGGTRLRITERGTVRNPLLRFVSRFIFGYTATMDAYLAALGKKLGEDVRPEPGD